MGSVLVHPSLASELVKQPTYQKAMEEIASRYSKLNWDIKPVQDEESFTKWQEAVKVSADRVESNLREEASRREFDNKAVGFLQELSSQNQESGITPAQSTDSANNP